MPLPPDDIILLFVAWIALLDTIDKTKMHPNLILDKDCNSKFKRVGSGGIYASVVGRFIVEKGMKQSWKFQ